MPLSSAIAVALIKLILLSVTFKNSPLIKEIDIGFASSMVP